MKTLDGALADLLCMVQQHGVPDPGLAHTDIATRELPSHPHGWDFGQLELEDPRDAAVLILFGSLDDRPAAYRDTLVPEELDVLLTQRALTLRKHPGQISFPGGARDLEDTSDTQCALREAQEETGLDPADVQPLGVLPSVPLSVSGFQVTPVVAWWTEPSRVAVVDAGEATRVFRVPVGDLVNPANRVLSAKNTGTGHRFTAPAFHVADTLVWGFTAIILDRILELTGWSEPWDHERVIDVSNWNAAQPVPAVTHLSQLPSSPTTVT